MKTTTWTLLLFNSPHHTSQIVTTLRSKMYESDFKPATVNEYSAISRQGNSTAGKTATRSRLMDLIDYQTVDSKFKIN